MDLDYFSNQNHITDLQKLNENELKPIIGLLEDVFEEFFINGSFVRKKTIKACVEVVNLFKAFNFILYGYMNIKRENDLSFCDKTNTERLISNIESIIRNLKIISTVRLLREKVIDRGNDCLRELWVFYNSMNDYITEEYNIWEAESCRQERLNERRYG